MNPNDCIGLKINAYIIFYYSLKIILLNSQIFNLKRIKPSPYTVLTNAALIPLQCACVARAIAVRVCVPVPEKSAKLETVIDCNCILFIRKFSFASTFHIRFGRTFT